MFPLRTSFVVPTLFSPFLLQKVGKYDVQGTSSGQAFKEGLHRSPRPLARHLIRTSECARCSLQCNLDDWASGASESSWICNGCDRAWHVKCLPMVECDDELCGEDHSQYLRDIDSEADVGAAGESKRKRSSRRVWFCPDCPTESHEQLLSPLRRGLVRTLTQTGREFLNAVRQGRTPTLSEDNTISEPFGCGGFQCVRGLIGPDDLQNLEQLVGQCSERPNSFSQLIPHTAGKSSKVLCCTDDMRNIRGGRYSGVLRSLTRHPLISYELSDGRGDLNAVGALSSPSPEDSYCSGETSLHCNTQTHPGTHRLIVPCRTH
jgi:hypothetical protein